ncbi:MAG: TlpA disulfide reductase family protein [Candidatus Binatia bacterium]
MTSLTALFYRVSKPQRILIFSAAGLLILALAFYLLKQTGASSMNAARKEAPKIGFVAPDFELEDVDGKAVQLAKFRGENPVFLSFWASWCPACRQEAPEKEKLHQMLGPKGLKLLSISIEKGPAALNNVRKFMEEFKISFNPLLDAKGDVMELYGVTAIPTTFLIDRQGKIVAKEVGPKNWTSSGWLNRLEELFK